MLFIFDWDGTILDSAAKIVRCMKLAMEDAGLEVLEAERIEQIIGLGMQEATDELFPSASPEQKVDLQQQYSKRFIAADQAPCSFFPGCLDVLTGLRDNNHLTAVATGKSRRGLDRVLASTGIEHLFDATRCADETASKPDPRMLHELLEELSVPAADALMIGDTSFDLTMARKAGVIPVGVGHGVHSSEQLIAAGAEYIAASYADLSDWLEEHYSVYTGGC